MQAPIQVAAVKPGGFSFLDLFDVSTPVPSIEGDELILHGVGVRDKDTRKEREIFCQGR